MYISAKVDYAVRVLLVLAASPDGAPIKAEPLAASQGLPQKFVENTLVELRRAGFVTSQRGVHGGYRLALPASEITLAQVFRSVDGPLAEVRGRRPEEVSYEGAAADLQVVWVAVRAALRSVLDAVTLADVLDGPLPPPVVALLEAPDAWERRPVGPAARP